MRLQLDLSQFFDAMIQLRQSGQGASLQDHHLEFLNPIDRSKLSRLLLQVERINKLKFDSTKHYRTYNTKKRFDGRRGYLLGKIFEELIQVIFKDSQIFSLQSRVVTAQCEIDFFVHLIQPYSNLFELLQAHTRLHGEAKCHAVSPKSEWVNTQAGKMTSNGTRLGMIFTFNHVGAAPSQFRTAIKDHFRSQPPTEIIPWGPTLIQELLKGTPFLKLMQIQSNLAYTGTATLKL
ncbi:hypothetical protein ACLWBD_07715 [Bdellovibrio sp. HCB117]|uniref:hypothetical protein n=1 Tax=Bdellovibrio sp. HCB117 TaxID=3394359 RepID=UPI0039B484FC